MMDAWQSLALFIALIGHAATVAYWGGRLVGELRGIAQRVDRLERNLDRLSPPPAWASAPAAAIPPM